MMMMMMMKWFIIVFLWNDDGIRCAGAWKFPFGGRSPTVNTREWWMIPEDLLPVDIPRRSDLLVALQAVRKASHITQQLQPDLPYSVSETIDNGTSTSTGIGKKHSTNNNNHPGIGIMTKPDTSPVTVADFAAQAVVLQHLHHMYPTDEFIAEETSDHLFSSAQTNHHHNNHHHHHHHHHRHLQQEILEASGMETIDQLRYCIDLGQSYHRQQQQQQGNPNGQRRRVWCLDPIDGTKGFLRGKKLGGQYCIALCLLEDGRPTIGILACPNLPKTGTDFVWGKDDVEPTMDDHRGCIFVATNEGGCWQLSLRPGQYCQRLDATTRLTAQGVVKSSDARFCIGVEEGFADPDGKCKAMAKILHGSTNALDKTTGDIVKACRIDSQAKYGMLARGDAEFYVRLPKSDYREWIWDVAPGIVILQEAGGRVTDVHGNDIDCSQGVKLVNNAAGILGANDPHLHDALFKSYQEQERNQR